MKAGRTEPDRFELLASAAAFVSPEFRSPHWFYPSLGHQDALERLRHSSAPGTLVVISGAEGIGKTLLLSVLLDTLARSVVPVVINDPEVNRPDTRFLRSLIEGAGGTPHGRTGLDLTADLLDQVETFRDKGRTVSILIDDAHQLSGSQLEILRTILSSASGTYPLNLILFGEPELLDKIGRKRRLAERVSMHHALNPLNPDDARAMLDHRLSKLNIKTTALFTNDAVTEVYTRSGGIPGLMLMIAHQALELVIERGEEIVDGSLIQRVTEPAIEPVQQIRLPLGSEVEIGEPGSPATS